MLTMGLNPALRQWNYHLVLSKPQFFQIQGTPNLGSKPLGLGASPE